MCSARVEVLLSGVVVEETAGERVRDKVRRVDDLAQI